MKPLTPRQKDCLRMLREAEKRGERWQTPPFRKRLLRALFEQDLIFESRGIDGTVKYCITGRGKRALEEAERPKRRRDGLCPKCGTRPRARLRSGRLHGYCAECRRATARACKARGNNAVALCSRCGARPQKVYKSGNVDTYCAECRRAVALEHQRKYRDRAEQSMLRCRFPGCEKPVMVGSSWASVYCEEHYRAHHRRQSKLRRLRALSGIEELD